LRDRGIPVALSMAGGYGRDIHETVALQARTLALAADSWGEWQQQASRPVEQSPA
jgi:hypothetical protein